MLLRAIRSHVPSAVTVHLTKHVRKCTEGREEERSVKEHTNICADFGGGFGGSDPQSVAFKGLTGLQAAFHISSR